MRKMIHILRLKEVKYGACSCSKSGPVLLEFWRNTKCESPNLKFRNIVSLQIRMSQISNAPPQSKHFFLRLHAKCLSISDDLYRRQSPIIEFRNIVGIQVRRCDPINGAPQGYHLLHYYCPGQMSLNVRQFRNGRESQHRILKLSLEVLGCN